MLRAFTWMFKKDEFKEYFGFLLKTYLKFILVALILVLIGLLIMAKNLLVSYVIFGTAVIILFLPCFFIQGYFWDLTENVILREVDIYASSIYDGKVKEIYKINFPNKDVPKLIWRGFASFVASLLMAIPFAVLLTSGTFITALAALPFQTVIFIYLFLCSLIPALLWNYASKNSLFAVWDIRQAIYLMGNYGGKYVLNTFLFIVFYLLNYVVLTLLGIAFQINDFSFWSNSLPLAIICYLIFYFITFTIHTYSIHVNAYLLGTIAKVGEY